MDVLQEIAHLDPVRDAHRICFLSGAYHFPEDNRLALELALFRTFCVPAIGSLLDRSGQFARHSQKRYDDTVLIMAEIIEHGPTSSRGQTALRRLNEVHAYFKIDNADYLYVLSTFLFEPIRWIGRYGWRRLSQKEIDAGFVLWSEIGRGMGIMDIPATYDDFEAFNRRYEREHFAADPGGSRVAEATLGLFLEGFPRLLRPGLRLGIYALLDEPVRRAFNYPRPPRIVSCLVTGLLRIRAIGLRLGPKRRRPLLRTKMRHPSYPEGHSIDDLGFDRPRPKSPP